jgi:hypothetical protein
MMPLVMIEDPPRMNLLGLLLGNVIERNLSEPAHQRRLGALEADVMIQAGEMVVTLSFSRGQLTIARGASEKAKAGIRGSLDALMHMALGRGLIGPLLSGRIKISGNPFTLLKIKPLMMVKE